MTGLAKQTKLDGFAVAALVAALFALAAILFGVARADDRNNQMNGLGPGAAAPAQGTPLPPARASPQPDQANQPGFLHQLKVWWDDSVALFDIRSKDTRGRADDANKKPDDAGKAPTDTVKDEAKDATKNASKDGGKSATTATQDAMKNAMEATKGAAATATGVATDAMKGAVEATKNAATAIVRLPNTRVVDLHETCARAPNGASDCAAAAASGCRAKGFSGGNPLDTRSAEKCDPKPPQPGQMPGVHCASETVVIRAVCQ